MFDVLLGGYGAVLLFLAMLMFVELGRRFGRRRLDKEGEAFGRGVAPAESAVFALLGLLVAFTFSGAAARFEARRYLITQEANDIGTAWLRIDMLPADTQSELRGLFRLYADARIASYGPKAGEAGVVEKRAEAAALQDAIWAKSVAALRRPDVVAGAAQVVVPGLNAMFDITTTRATANENHPPVAIFVLLAVLCVVGSLLFGYGAAPNPERNWLHKLAFAGIMACTVFVILDLEYPRAGWIRIDEADHVLVDVRRTMT